MHHLKHRLISCALLCLSAATHAYTVERFVPQGNVGVVRAAVARFSEPMNPLGAQTAAPFDVACSSADSEAKNVQKGSGRWINEREWEYRFDNQLPVASKCDFTLKSGVTAVLKSSNTGKTVFSFSTGGPAVVRMWPDGYQRIEEQQMFVVHASGPLDMASVAANVRCTTSKVGEQIGVDLITGKERDDVLAAVLNPRNYGEDKQPKADRLVVLRCKQALGEDAQVKILWGKGVATPSGAINTELQQRAYNTQAAFRATASCEREQAGKPCIPVRPITLNFTAAVPIKWAKAIRLSGGKKDVKTTLDAEGAEPANSEATTTSVSFAAPLEQSTSYRIVLPPELVDLIGRKLANATAFPMNMATGTAPALAKFAARFGIVERAVGVLPVTVRALESPLRGKTGSLLARELATSDDAQVARLMLLTRLEEQREWAMRSASLLGKTRASKPLPAVPTQRETEVVGIPLQAPGLHVVEIESPALGAALLNKTEAQRSQNMYVRGYALVTGMAVHFKLSAENAAVWVTSLETGKPVASAAVQVSDCNGKALWKGSTDASGIARINAPLVRSKCTLKPKDIQGIADGGSLAQIDELKEGYTDDTSWLLASARTADDYSFALSSWTNGIEPWRFNVNTLYNAKPEGSTIAHTIFARNLLRQGETVHMKHLVRTENSKGLALPLAKAGAELYEALIIQHIGSDQTFKVPLKWLNTGAAVSEWKVPAEGKLGMYSVALKRRADLVVPGRPAAEEGEMPEEMAQDQLDAGSFQVAQFRLPTLQGNLTTTAALVNVKTLPLSVQMNYLNGGAAAGLGATVSALLQQHSASFNGYNEFSFDLPSYELTDELRASIGLTPRSDSNAELILDKAAIKLNDKGMASQPIELAKQVRPVSLRAELNYRDPNGEVQTIGNSFTLWPAKVVLGYKQGGWFSDGAARQQRWVVLDLQGKPVTGASVAVQGIQKLTNTVRKRTVGGFYTYDSSSSTKDLGTVCEGKTDAQGMFVCDLNTEKFNGNVVLLGRAKDADGNSSIAGTSLWLGRADYFKPDDSDRMDLLAEKRVVNTGDVARFQVRLPFANATAWVAVEREGVIDTFAVELSRSKPTIDVPIKAEYAPNVFVSVLAIRPRLQPLGWGSFFDWGWKSPLKWWRERKASRIEPTAMVDLAKPAYRLGLAELQVNSSANTLKVEVGVTPAQVQTREVTTASVRVLLPDGKPVPAGTRVAIAVVDEALLELKPNDSWDLLGALWKKRGYGVETATAQMQVIGKRHFGLKALPPGGGGGRGATRELLETLAYWNPDVALDADGRAQVPVTLNDSLTKFRVVALADVGGGLFGSGNAFVTVAKDLQLISGLPPLVRDEDQFTAGVTLRNTTTRAMKVAFSANRDGAVAFEKAVDIAAQSATEITWPSATAAGQTQALWVLSAQEQVVAGGKAATDALKVTQKITPATPVVTWAATLLRVEQTATVPVQPPVGAILSRGGVKASFASSITGSLDPVRDWFVRYPFYCLEQRTSKAVGLRDPALWKIITDSLPTYLDADGLANYFPGDSRLGGSDVLTAYVLATAHEAGWQLPEDAKARMLAGLEAFVQGKLKRDYWAPQRDDAVRRIAAIEALSRYGRATPAMLTTVSVAPNSWPTSALIDWLALLQRVNVGSAVPQRDKLLAEATQVLRARMGFSGTRIAFDDEKRDHWWWLMVNSDTNAARLVLAALDNKLGVAEWLQDMPRLVNGLVARQQRGVWSTTTANVWGSLALEKYAAAFERTPVTGQTTLALDGAAGQNTAWQGGNAEAISAPWPKDGRAVQASVTHSGSGKPYVTLQAQAAVPEAPQTNAGYRLTKSISAVSQKTSGTWARGDVYRVDIEIVANAPMSWVALSDPIPGGSTILGSGLRDSAAEQVKSAQNDAKSASGDSWSWAWLAYEERSFEGYRAYYEYLPKGSTRISYTVRLNQAGSFALPATRAEAMYAPEVFGSNPNARWTVAP